jgi:hypothetical protein
MKRPRAAHLRALGVAEQRRAVVQVPQLLPVLVASREELEAMNIAFGRPPGFGGPWPTIKDAHLIPADEHGAIRVPDLVRFLRPEGKP